MGGREEPAAGAAALYEDLYAATCSIEIAVGFKGVAAAAEGEIADAAVSGCWFNV